MLPLSGQDKSLRGGGGGGGRSLNGITAKTAAKGLSHTEDVGHRAGARERGMLII